MTINVAHEIIRCDGTNIKRFGPDNGKSLVLRVTSTSAPPCIAAARTCKSFGSGNSGWIDSDFSGSISDSGNASPMIDSLYWKDAWTEAGSVLSAALAASRSTSGDHNGKSRLCSDIVSKVSVNVIE